jgi:hypothetical protein
LTAIISYVLITTATNNNGCHNQEAQLCPDYADQFGVMFLLGKFGAPEKFFASALTGIFLTGLAAHSITKTNIKPVMRFIEWIGQKSLDLFILNGFFLLFIEKKFIQQHFKVGTSLLETTVCGHHYLLYSIFPPENHSTNNQQPAACLQEIIKSSVFSANFLMPHHQQFTYLRSSNPTSVVSRRLPPLKPAAPFRQKILFY